MGRVVLLQNNRQLLAQFREGDRQAMAQVFDHYCDGIAQVLTGGFTFRSGDQTLRFDGVRQRHELHDLLAETFRRAFEERSRLAYNGLSPYVSYLRSIARNLVIDRLRDRRNRWTELKDDAADMEPDSLASPERAYQRSELSGLMRAFVDGLSPTERRFVELRYQEGQSQEHVAKRMRKSRRWVRSLEARLRQRLVGQLRDTGYLRPTGAGT